MANEITMASLLAGGKGKIELVTPVGVAVFPHLIKPDDYQLKTNNKYECNTGLRLDPAQPGVAAFITQIDTYVQESYDAGKAEMVGRIATTAGKKLVDLKKAIEDLKLHKPYDMDYDAEGNETGSVVFKTKTSVSGVDKKSQQRWNREVPIMDAKGVPIKGAARAALKLWGGSRIAICVQVVPFCAEGLFRAGVSLRIVAVQVRELGGSSRETFGFGVEEGGFSSSDIEHSGEEEASGNTSAGGESSAEDGDSDF